MEMFWDLKQQFPEHVQEKMFDVNYFHHQIIQLMNCTKKETNKNKRRIVNITKVCC